MKIICKSQEDFTLAQLNDGEAFRPANSRLVYIKSHTNGQSDLLAEQYELLATHYVNVQNLEWQECHELILCINLADGETVLFHKDMKIIPLKTAIVIEEDNAFDF